MNGKIDHSLEPDEIAHIIFNEFSLLQSTCIKGFAIIGEDIFRKGDIVVRAMERLDRIENFKTRGNIARGGVQEFVRKKPVKKNTIGVYVESKAFKYKWEVRDGKEVLNLWRVQ